MVAAGGWMIILDKALERRAAEGAPVRIALIGAGYIARGIAAHTMLMRGIELVAVSNRTIDRAARLFEELGRHETLRVGSREQLEEAIVRRIPAVVDDPGIVCCAEGIDVIVEATGELEFAAGVVLEAITHGKHVVLVNAELDATLGPLLKAKADEAGVIITNTDGDEPGVTLSLVRYVKTIGLRPVLAGNIKGFLDRHRTPDTQRAFAESVGQDPQKIASYADGTKLAMEAAIVANATGFGVARQGMTGYECRHVNEVLRLFEPDAMHDGIVDYVLGAEPGSGAFVVGQTDDPVIQKYLGQFKMGDGPGYLFCAPWHLPQAEAPLTAARAALFQDAAVAPLDGPQCDVIAVTKRDLRAGDVLDGPGGFTCYGAIDNVDTTRRESLLPMGVATGCTTVRDVPMDQPLTYDDVAVPADRLVDYLRAEQERRFFTGNQS